MIYEHFRVTVSHGTILELSDLVNITLKGDNVQGFDAKWDEVLLSMRDAPKDDMLESMCKTTLRDSEQLRTTCALCNQDPV